MTRCDGRLSKDARNGQLSGQLRKNLAWNIITTALDDRGVFLTSAEINSPVGNRFVNMTPGQLKSS
jgi:hypothetical protein